MYLFKSKLHFLINASLNCYNKKKITLNIFKIKIYHDLKSKFKKILYCYLNILYVVKEKINKNDKFM